jgi:trimeric autotransporter adhesin
MRIVKILECLKLSRAQWLSAALVFSAGVVAYAVPNVFIAGTTLSAAQMNANFANLEARIAALEAKLANVMLTTVNGQPTVLFTGVNVQVVNGAGSTNTINGTGNLIVGYDEADGSGTGRCSLGTNTSTGLAIPNTQANCTSAGGTWSTTGFKTGSHYIVAGAWNSYSRFGGVVFGFQNASNYNYASVTGGLGNTASGNYASVSGGGSNSASGNSASVTGGSANTASGSFASVTGGEGNTASGNRASVTGGLSNSASNYNASVTGGLNNTASGTYASVSGGDSNTASGVKSNVSSGFRNTASGLSASVSGGWQNVASGDQASVSGGQMNTASGNRASVSGGQDCNTGILSSGRWIVGQWGASGCSATSN